jgi:hypothetical protein
MCVRYAQNASGRKRYVTNLPAPIFATPTEPAPASSEQKSPYQVFSYFSPK